MIIEPPVLVPSIDSQFDVTCFGNDDGLIIATAFGGTPAPGGSYLYSIDGINFTPNNVFDNVPFLPSTFSMVSTTDTTQSLNF